MIGARRLLLFISLLLAICLTACGRRGSPVPPGPPDQVIFPKTYPVVP
jgi:hypothetical protein